MEKKITVTAVCGWALPPEGFCGVVASCFPGANVKVLYPSHPEDPEEAEHLLGLAKADLYIGYSLGSLWLMTHREKIPPGQSVKAVLAPILAFAQERNRGGKTPETQLKYLRKKIRRNPRDLSPLLEFYSDCEIQFSESFRKNIPATPALLNGLEFLQMASVSGKQAEQFTALAGENDIFLDSAILKQHIPHLEIVQGAGHAPHPLVKRLAEQIKF